MYWVVRVSYNISADLEAGYTCFETAETPLALARTMVAQLALEAAELDQPETDEEALDLMERAGLDVRRRPDGRWGIFDHDGLSAWFNPEIQALDAIRQRLDDVLADTPGSGTREIVFYPDDVMEVHEVADGVYAIRVKDFWGVF